MVVFVSVGWGVGGVQVYTPAQKMKSAIHPKASKASTLKRSSFGKCVDVGPGRCGEKIVNNVNSVSAGIAGLSLFFHL